MKKKITIIGLLVIVCALFLGIGYASVTGSVSGTIYTRLTPEEIKLAIVDSDLFPVRLETYPNDSSVSFSYSNLDKSVIITSDNSPYLGNSINYTDSLSFSVATRGTADKRFYVKIPVINLSKDLDVKNLQVNITNTGASYCGTPLKADGSLDGSIAKVGISAANTVLDTHYTLINNTIENSVLSDFTKWPARTTTSLNNNFILKTLNIVNDTSYYGSDEDNYTDEAVLDTDGEGFISYVLVEFYVTHSVDTDVVCSYNVSVTGESAVTY